MKNILAFRVITLCAIGTLVACAGPPASTEQQATGNESSTSFTPVTVENCGINLHVTKPLSRAITLNQGITEEVLSLKLGKQLAAHTKSGDGPISPRWIKEYNSIKTLGKDKINNESFISEKPDLALASYASAFTLKYGVGDREDLQKQGILTYLSPFACPDKDTSTEITFDNVWSELTDIAKIFGHPGAAKGLIREQKVALEKIRAEQSGKGKKIFWYDSGENTPTAGVAQGGPALILDAVGATNIFSDLGGGWKDVSWERVVASQPDIIALVDVEWDTKDKKIRYLENDPVLKNLEAVKKKSYVIVPFAESTPGVRLVDGAEKVSQGIKSIA